MSRDGGFHPGHNAWAVALTVTIATFMEVLDTSIANVALRHIAGDLSVGEDESTWVLTSYLVSNAIVLPMSGWLAAKFGRKNFYMTCVAIFTVSSLMCGLAPNLATLIVCRVLQGAGGGGLGPSEQSILADTFPESKRGMAFAVYGMAVVLAPAIGPTLGGYITDHFSWRWVFFINVPVGVFSLFLSHRMVKDPPYLEKARKKIGKFDFMGFIFLALGLGSLEVVLDKGQTEDWFSSTYITIFAVTAAVSLVTFVFWELSRKTPLVDLRLLGNRNFGAATLMMLMVGATLFGTTVLVPQFVQTLMGYTATLAGEALSPGGVLIIMLMPLVGTLISRVDGRKMIAFGFTCLAASMFYMAHHLYGQISFTDVVLLRCYQAFGLAFLFVPISTVAYVGLSPEKNGQASGLINLARNMGGDIGIAGITTLLARRAQIHQNDLVAHTSRFDKPFSDQLDGLTRSFEHAGSSSAEASRKAIGTVSRLVSEQAQTLAYVDTLWIFAFLTMFMVPLALLMKKSKPGAAAAAH